MIGGFRSSFCSVVPASSCSLSGPLLYRSPVVVFFDRGYHIHASGISIPLSLLMLLGWSLMWIASLTLRVYQWGFIIASTTMNNNHLFLNMLYCCCCCCCCGCCCFSKWTHWDRKTRCYDVKNHVADEEPMARALSLHMYYTLESTTFPAKNTVSVAGRLGSISLLKKRQTMSIHILLYFVCFHDHLVISSCYYSQGRF